jgi:phosphoadenosine phosphosulfate reductase|nr:MAG TPA: GMP synthase [Caudoviricetes sp.]
MNLDKKIDYSIALLRKAESMALRLDPENGFYLSFSGGKDSQALYHIAQMAGVKFKAHMNLTSVTLRRSYVSSSGNIRTWSLSNQR